MFLLPKLRIVQYVFAAQPSEGLKSELGIWPPPTLVIAMSQVGITNVGTTPASTRIAASDTWGVDVSCALPLGPQENTRSLPSVLTLGPEE